MTVRAWTHFFGTKASGRQHAIVTTLARAGIEDEPLTTDEKSRPGILIFEEIGEELLGFLRELSRNGLERVLVVGTSPSKLTEDKVWTLVDAGASDVLCLDDASEFAPRIAARIERWKAVDELLDSPLVKNNLVGQSPKWKSLLRQVIEVGRFTNASVLVLGESGTGKELVARLIHTLDPRANKRELVVLDCTTIVPDLSGSEFFGHERGAYTGAVGPRDGAFALANCGSLFLDEIGELPQALQAQLLRAVQEHKYKRVGANKWQHTDFRLVCATNKDLARETEEGRFRSDLYYRIAEWTFRLPSLRERNRDILLLAKHFIQEVYKDDRPPELDSPVREYLAKRTYPGNIRELKQLISRISQRHVGNGPITIGDIPEDDRPCEGSRGGAPLDWRDRHFDEVIDRALTQGAGLKDISQYASEAAIRIAIGEEEGNLQRAAKKLGVTDRALQMRRANKRN